MRHLPQKIGEGHRLKDFEKLIGSIPFKPADLAGRVVERNPFFLEKILDHVDTESSGVAVVESIAVA